MRNRRTDGELLAAFAETGDEPAFREIVSRYSGLVFHAALRSMGDRGLAGFMPASSYRDDMVFHLVRTGNPADAESIMAFLRELGIDPQALEQRMMDEHRRELGD